MYSKSFINYFEQITIDLDSTWSTLHIGIVISQTFPLFPFDDNDDMMHGIGQDEIVYQYVLTEKNFLTSAHMVDRDPPLTLEKEI